MSQTEIIPFSYHDDVLHAEQVDLKMLSEQIGTPFYCYSTAAMRGNYQALHQAFSETDHLICYAVKANANQAVIKTIASLGGGCDVVSEGEIRRALAAGIEPKKIVFSGVGKSAQEINFALQKGIGSFNIESEAELEFLVQIAHSQDKCATISLRVNPHIDAETHHKISTGRAGDKFGISAARALALYDYAAGRPNIEIGGVAMHIGSQITKLAPFEKAFVFLAEFAKSLLARGHKIKHLDLGGGIGIAYDGSDRAPFLLADYAQLVKKTLGFLGLQYILEPGRSLVGSAGILVARVLYIKHTEHKSFVIQDAAMNDLIRPSLYDAYHHIIPICAPSKSDEKVRVDVVGPVCETGDFFAHDRLLPSFKSNDLLAIMGAGAYGSVQANNYNSRLLVPEVLVSGEDWALCRPRQTYQDLIDADRLAPWQV